MSQGNQSHSDSFSMRDIDVQDPVGKLVQHTMTCLITDTGSKANDVFEQQSALEGIVVLDKDKPVGLIMRSDYYQKIGTQYGYSLYSKRPVSYLMEPNMLIVADSVEISKVSSLAMKRDHKNIYDMVVVVKNDVYLGVVSIRNFLMELTQKREKQIELLKIANQKEKAFSEMIASTNAELNLKNESIKNILDNAGQGFLTFAENLGIDDEYSLECVRIFGFEIKEHRYIDLIRPYFDETTVNTVMLTLDMLFGNKAEVSSEVFFSLLPQEMIIHGKTIALEYKLIDTLNNKIMVIMTDITEKVEMNKKMKEEERNLRLILKAIQSYDDLKMSIDEMSETFRFGFTKLIQESRNTSETTSTIFRIVHTYKGELAQHGLYNASANLHEIENRLDKLLAVADSSSQLEQLENLVVDLDPQVVLAGDLQVIANALGDDYFTKSESYQITKKQVEAINDQILRLCPEEQQPLLVATIKQLLCRNFKDFLKEYDGYVEYLATRLDKSILPLQILGDDIFVYKPIYSGVIKSLVHIIRNSIDHGIESADDRIEAGKSPYASITCKITESGPDSFTLAITDDGQGINLQKIREKVLQGGLATEAELSQISTSALLSYIFKDHFSTKNNIDMLSGRGLGLSAVKNEAEKLGGCIEVTSREGQGTEFLITLPIISHFDL